MRLHGVLHLKCLIFDINLQMDAVYAHMFEFVRQRYESTRTLVVVFRLCEANCFPLCYCTSPRTTFLKQWAIKEKRVFKGFRLCSGVVWPFYS